MISVGTNQSGIFTITVDKAEAVEKMRASYEASVRMVAEGHGSLWTLLPNGISWGGKNMAPYFEVVRIFEELVK